MNNRYIYLVFSKTGTWLSKIIKFTTQDKYIHVSLSLDSSLRKMYSFGRTNPNNPFCGGFVVEDLYSGVYSKFKNSTCLIYRVPITEKQYEALVKELDYFLLNKNKYRYNLLGLFFVLINKSFIRKNFYFCSQFVSEILMKSSIYSSNKKSEFHKPMDLLSIKNKEFIYEGLIKNYVLYNNYTNVI
ncbi:hypothetical protein CM240_1117 [Clostridium bornimense]|uniref:Uncharacterized protein n=1 Tax=Clostridium bornimense TaxID=1216932 RepID=W6RUF4_9CLOT|nr:hypothetical protein [Clostridium bornimense]CDM68281.1 hypothetical protein CM240_1117 [Clostridium bornimense]